MNAAAEATLLVLAGIALVGLCAYIVDRAVPPAWTWLLDRVRALVDAVVPPAIDRIRRRA